MSKPMELIVYPRGVDHYGSPCYTSPDGKELWITEWSATEDAQLIQLSDSELAAEYYKQDSKCRHEQWIETVRDDDYTDSERGGQQRMYDQLNTLYRFATTPHHWQDATDG